MKPKVSFDTISFQMVDRTLLRVTVEVPLTVDSPYLRLDDSLTRLDRRSLASLSHHISVYVSSFLDGRLLTLDCFSVDSNGRILIDVSVDGNPVLSTFLLSKGFQVLSTS